MDIFEFLFLFLGWRRWWARLGTLDDHDHFCSLVDMAERFVIDATQEQLLISRTQTHSVASSRILNSSYRVGRPPNHIGRYKMVRHEKREAAVNRSVPVSLRSSYSFVWMFSRQLLHGWQRYRQDGVAQLTEVDYQITQIEKKALFTHILVNITRSSTNKLDHLLS